MGSLTRYLVAAVLTLAAAPAPAASILGLFNTGTDASNVALVGGNGVVDPHWTIVSSTSPGFAGQQARTFFTGPYIANDANSRWVSLTGTGTPINNTTTYRLSFDLSGLDYTTAVITGRWAADNSGSIRLNGAATGFQRTGLSNFGSYQAFTLSSGFVGGANTLDFIVSDAGVVTALRVDDLSGTADLAPPTSPVPEPAVWSLMMLGFATTGAVVRRRRNGGRSARSLVTKMTG